MERQLTATVGALPPCAGYTLRSFVILTVSVTGARAQISAQRQLVNCRGQSEQQTFDAAALLGDVFVLVLVGLAGCQPRQQRRCTADRVSDRRSGEQRTSARAEEEAEEIVLDRQRQQEEHNNFASKIRQRSSERTNEGIH